MGKVVLRDITDDPSRYDQSLLVLVPKAEDLGPETEVTLQESKWPRLPVPDGMRLMFDIETLAMVMRAWRKHANGREPSPSQAASAVAHYDKYDAFIDPS